MSSSEEEDVPGCETSNCCFKYLNDEHRKRALTAEEADAAPLVLDNVNVSLPDASRVVLVGANGAGKSTLLELFAGKRRPTAGTVQAGGVDSFYAPDGHSCLLTAAWAHDLGSMASLPVSQLLESAAGVPANAATATAAASATNEEVRRRAVHLASVLEVDAAWQTGELSEGQRRRVQLATKLAKPTQLVLLDEVTAELDVLARRRLLKFLGRDASERGACVVYCTHVFDGLAAFATHAVQLESGCVLRAAPLASLGMSAHAMDSMHDAVLAWLKEGRALARREPSSPSSSSSDNQQNQGKGAEKDEAAATELAQADGRLFASILAFNGPADAPTASVATSHFSWGFRGATPLFRDLSFELAPGSRCLLTGANGAGKTTLLAILGGSRLPIGHNDPTIIYNDNGNHGEGVAVDGAAGTTTTIAASQETRRKGVTIVPSQSQVRVCGIDPGVNHTAANHNTVHVSIAWRRSLAEVLKGGTEQKFGDLFDRALSHAIADLSALLRPASEQQQEQSADVSPPVSSLSAAPSPAEKEAAEKEERVSLFLHSKAALIRRADRLTTCLGVQKDWVISKLSAGQKARVQLALQLLRPKKVLLMDEVTAELDVEARARLLAFLKEDSEGPMQLTVIYATHVFDGLSSWASHLLHLTKPNSSSSPPSTQAGAAAAAAAAASSTSSGRLVTVADALINDTAAAAEEKEKAAATTTATVPPPMSKKPSIYSVVLKWLIEENRAARRALQQHQITSEGGGGEGAIAEQQFPTTAPQRRAKQDARISARSTAVAREKGDLPDGWGYRANALPGGLGGHIWVQAADECANATVSLPDFLGLSDDDEEEEDAGDRYTNKRSGQALETATTNRSTTAAPVKKRRLKPRYAAAKAAAEAAAAAAETEKAKATAPGAPAAAAAAAPAAQATVSSTPPSSSVAAAAASGAPPAQELQRGGVPSALLVPALGQLESAVATLKQKVAAAAAATDQTEAGRASADAAVIEASGAVNKLWTFLEPAVGQFAGKDSAANAGVASSSSSAAAGGGGGGGTIASAPAAPSSTSGLAATTNSSSTSYNPFGDGPRNNALTEEDIARNIFSA